MSFPVNNNNQEVNIPILQQPQPAPNQAQPSRTIGFLGRTIHLDMPISDRLAYCGNYLSCCATPSIATGTTFGSMTGSLLGFGFSQIVGTTIMGYPVNLTPEQMLIVCTATGSVTGALCGMLTSALVIDGMDVSLDCSPIGNPNDDIESLEPQNRPTLAQQANNNRNYQIASTAWKIATFFCRRNSDLC